MSQRISFRYISDESIRNLVSEENLDYTKKEIDNLNSRIVFWRKLLDKYK